MQRAFFIPLVLADIEKQEQPLNTIYAMNHAVDLAEQLREAGESTYQAARKARADQCADVCQAIADIMPDDYQAWVDATPAVGFYEAACDKLIGLMTSPAWTSYVPSAEELNQRVYNGLHVPGHLCPHCQAVLIVNERADKTTNPDRPFFTRRLVCPCWFTNGCKYKEKWSDEIRDLLYAEIVRLENAPAEF